MSQTGAALLRGGISRSLSMAVSMGTMLALVPLMVNLLGDRLYGAWLLVGTILGAFGLLDLGLSSAVNRFVARALGRGDRDDADRYIATAVYLFSIGAAAAFLITIVVALLSRRFVDGPTEEVLLFRNVILVTGLCFALSFPANNYMGVLEAHLRHDLASLLETAISIVRLVLFVAVLYGGGRLMALAVCGGFLLVLRAALVVHLAHRVHGPTRLRRGYFSWQRVRGLFSYSLVTFVAQVADLLRTRIFAVIIPQYLGLAAATPYGIATQLIGAANHLAGAVMATTAPVFSRQEARDDQAAIRWSYFFNYKLACYLAVFLVGMIAVLNRSFIIRWVGAERESAVLICHILLVGSLFSIMQIPTIHYMYGTSRHHYFAAVNILEGLANLVLSLALVQPYGRAGMAAGTAFAVILSKFFLLPLTAGWSLGTNLWRYHLLHTLPNVLRPGVFVGALYLAASPFLAPDYLRLAIVGGVASLLFVPYIFFVGFSRRERNLLLDSIRKIRGERKSAAGDSHP